MDDLIDIVKINGKHSFKDENVSIIESKKLYGKQTALLGGIDVDKLTRLEPNKLRKYVRNIIGICSLGGEFVIGSGNSIHSYVPLENYFIMLDDT